jgi:guanosine-3',5'-bis(diphosphate) 3'-pyrophosphohydrolase
VAEIVDGVSKLDQIEFKNREEAQAENFRKMLLAMARDVRVILIKLADRTAQHAHARCAMRPESAARIARETLDIYAPIANRLGLNNLYRELQDLGVPPRSIRCATACWRRRAEAARGNRSEVVGKILEGSRPAAEAGIEAEVEGARSISTASTSKMREKRSCLLAGARHLRLPRHRRRADLLPALGALHGLYKPVPGKFKDYIAIPKVNGYQSLHTTLFGPFGTPVEVQIRTADMHRIAEAGVAAHWLYKDDAASSARAAAATHQWLQSCSRCRPRAIRGVPRARQGRPVPRRGLRVHAQGQDPARCRAARPVVDFAYAVHTDIGNRCVAAASTTS